MKQPITGGCCCGAVRYEIFSEPLGGFNCHCRTCQKSVGAAFFSAMFVTESALKIIGHYKEYATLATSGHTMYRGFCPKCGSSLFGRNSAFADIRPVSAVTLDDPSIFKAQYNIWVADAQPWVCMDPNLPKFAGNFQ